MLTRVFCGVSAQTWAVLTPARRTVPTVRRAHWAYWVPSRPTTAGDALPVGPQSAKLVCVSPPQATRSWSTARLSQPRQYITAAAAGGKARPARPHRSLVLGSWGNTMRAAVRNKET